jgi:Kef-type K+ transport system membrane component KefB
MDDLHFTNLLVVCAIAFAAPLGLSLFPKVRLPAVVLLILAGIAVGPSGLDWVQVDDPVDVFALVGLAMLLFLAGLGVEFHRLRGRMLRLTLGGFVVSFGLAVAVGFALHATGAVRSPLFVAIVLSATSLGLLVPLLDDAGVVDTSFGQLIIAAASIADIATVALLSLLFSDQASTPGTKVILLGSLFLLGVAVFVAVRIAERSRRLVAAVDRLHGTTAEIKVRGAFALMIGFVALAQRLGLEVILGAFIAGALVSLLGERHAQANAALHEKLEAVGYGVFIPAFFVASGLRFDLGALTQSTSTLLRVPIFLLALVVVRGLPAVLYRRYLGSDRLTVVAGLFQATSLPFIVASTAIGASLHLLSEATAAGLVAAGLLSVLIFPLVGLTMLKRGGPAAAPPPVAPAAPATT